MAMVSFYVLGCFVNYGRSNPANPARAKRPSAGAHLVRRDPVQHSSTPCRKETRPNFSDCRRTISGCIRCRRRADGDAARPDHWRDHRNLFRRLEWLLDQTGRIRSLCSYAAPMPGSNGSAANQAGIMLKGLQLSRGGARARTRPSIDQSSEPQ